jgi:hypothetical protein
MSLQEPEESAMRQLLLGRVRRGVSHALRSGLLVLSLALLIVGCASQTLMPKEQAVAIDERDRALVSHGAAIQAAIRQSGTIGALAFLDAKDGTLVVLPGDSPADAWARYATSPESGTGRVSVPAVLTFVYRADVLKAPELVTQNLLQQQQAFRRSLTAFETELRDADRRTEQRLGIVQREQRELAEAIAATKQETDRSLAVVRADVQTALGSLAEELDSARKFMLQTAQLGWLNHELNVENAGGIRRVATASQELAANSARLADTMRQLSENLAGQLKELAGRLDAIQGLVTNAK